jgi:hypothetical protein
MCNQRHLRDDGTVVIYQRKDFNEANWHYQIRLFHVAGRVERKKTHCFVERDASRMATDQY